MGRFTIEMNYNASIIVEVNAEDEGKALDEARNIAEDADIREFTITSERESRILKRE